MNQILLTTNQSGVVIDDLGAVTFDFPLNNFVLHDTALTDCEFSLLELQNSADLQAAVNSGAVTLTDENGIILDDLAQAALIVQLDQVATGVTDTIYVNTTHTGISNGDFNAPFKTVQAALDSATGTANVEILNKEVIISQAIVLPDTLTSITICGNDTTIKYASYDVNTAENVIEQTSTSYTGVITLKNITLQNGTNGLLINSATKVVVDNCKALNNGYNNTNFSTVLPSSGSRLGYDSTAADLQNFYTNEVEHFAAGLSIYNTPFVEISGSTIKDNNLGVLLTDCGISGAGYITRNQITQNYTASITLIADFSNTNSVGCQNIITTINSLSYNGSYGVICHGGINNKFSQNDLTKNWNAAFINYGCANVTLRDSSIYDNNFIDIDSSGQVFSSAAAVVITEIASLGFLNNNLQSNPDAKFIMEILDNQIHYTGSGSAGAKVGIYISPTVGALQPSEKNIINIDDNTFIPRLRD